MLAIRMQRTGRKGHAQFRLIVQEARRSPVSGNVVAALGHYDPHSKVVVLDKEKAAFYLEHGAQPSPRLAVIMQKEGVKLPEWVKIDSGKKGAIKNAAKLRRNQPNEPKVAAEAPTEAAPASETVEAEAPVADEAPVSETETPETPAAEPITEAEAEVAATEPATEEAETETAQEAAQAEPEMEVEVTEAVAEAPAGESDQAPEAEVEAADEVVASEPEAPAEESKES